MRHGFPPDIKMDNKIITSNICTCGKVDPESRDNAIRNSREVRLIKILVAITCVACVTTVIACIYTVITVNRNLQQYHRQNDIIKSEQQSGHVVSGTRKLGQKMNKDETRDNHVTATESPELLEITTESDDAPKMEIPKIRKTGNTEKGRYIPGNKGSKGQRRSDLSPSKRLSGISTSTHNQPVISAVHYVPMDISTQFGQNDNCESKWGGTLCINNTYWSTEEHKIVQFFVNSSWTATSRGMPLKQTTPGNFKALKSGIYLLYLNMMIYASAVKNDVAIYIKDDKRLDCRETLDVVPTFDPVNRFLNAKSKTCSITGVFHINKGDIINVKIESRNTPVVLKRESTNFGAVLLISGNG
ncbi:hypothetical protein KUTeg_012062 [Tegillarca granosa]|uniref:TNF family profile domain-containing protein n=1 Tax=Tegillarca granosa TaxID=220873 RepID=A0ABQ9F2T7_TEGGR|nr:hypothetical protein KUTeg_012062 [Tegillarca granosa]